MIETKHKSFLAKGRVQCACVCVYDQLKHIKKTIKLGVLSMIPSCIDERYDF